MTRENPSYTITIRSWDKYQKKDTNKFIVLYNKMLHDPSIFALTLRQRWLWISCLLHAGYHGSTFTLTTQYMRSSFSLGKQWRHSTDFEALQEQGLVTFECLQIEERREEERREEDNSTVRSKPSAPKAVVVKLPDRFEDWWTAYPPGRKVKKKQTRDIWKRKRLDKIADQLIADVIHRASNDAQWLRGSRFVPHPTTYLNGERWNDETEAPEPTKAQRILSGLKQFDDAERAKEAENG